MLTMIREAYRESASAAIALPWLFALIFAVELIQHVIEVRIGLFDSYAAMETEGDHPARLGFGLVKLLVLAFAFYCANRWLAFRDEPGRSLLGDRTSATLFAAVVLYGIVLGVVTHLGGKVLSPIVADPTLLVWIGTAFFLLTLALDILLACWKVGAALGNRRLTIAASLRIMPGSFWWSIAYMIVMTLPLMLVHYALNVAAVGRPDAILWTLLALDSMVVGYLVFVLAATAFLIARRGAARAGVPLVEEIAVAR